ncbi:Stemmadenine O-acetyltransferase [Linum grandiflorum]
MQEAPPMATANSFQVAITSRETIKPSSPTIHLNKPYSLSCFDQLVPSTYIPLLIFHSLANANFDISHVIEHAKFCLSETLNVFYPLSGRIQNNSSVGNFDTGVPFLVAKVSSPLSHFLDSHQHNGSYLNQLLPCRPFAKERQEDIPLMAFQINIFPCGGVALGCGLCHKIGDSATGLSFARTWAAFFSGSRRRIARPDFVKASSHFPSRSPMPERYTSLIEKMWFRDSKFVTKRFFFNPESIASLRQESRDGGSGGSSMTLALPTSVEALSGFVWKCFISASRKAAALSGSPPKPSMLGLEVNLRKRCNPGQLEAAFGNLFWPATAVVGPEQSSVSLQELVRLISDAVAEFDEEYVKSLQGEEGLENISRSLDSLQEMLEMEPDVLEIGSVCNLGMDQMDFGAGDPGMVTIGDVRKEFSNFVILAEARLGKGIEAWMIIEENKMGFLERDPEFLKFAVPITSIKMSKL